MKKKLFSVTFWLIVFFSIVAVEGYSAFAQNSDLVGKWSKVVRKTEPAKVDCFTSFTQRSGGLYVVDKSTVFLSPLRPKWMAGDSCIENRTAILIP